MADILKISHRNSSSPLELTHNQNTFLLDIPNFFFIQLLISFFTLCLQIVTLLINTVLTCAMMKSTCKHTQIAPDGTVFLVVPEVSSPFSWQWLKAVGKMTCESSNPSFEWRVYRSWKVDGSTRNRFIIVWRYLQGSHWCNFNTAIV